MLRKQTGWDMGDTLPPSERRPREEGQGGLEGRSSRRRYDSREEDEAGGRLGELASFEMDRWPTTELSPLLGTTTGKQDDPVSNSYY